MPIGTEKHSRRALREQTCSSHNAYRRRATRSAAAGALSRQRLCPAYLFFFPAGLPGGNPTDSVGCPQQVGSGFEWSLQLFLEADGTRAPQDARRGWTRRGGGGRNSLNITIFMHDARRAAAWRRRRVAVARPVRIAFVRIFVFSRVSKKNRK